MKNITIALVSLVLVIAGYFGVKEFTGQDSQKPQESTNQNVSSPSPSQSPGQQEKTNTVSQNNSGVYKEYSEQAVSSAEGDVYLFFHAPWCPQCRSIESGIESDGVPQDITILKVDYDSSQDLKKKYGVTLQTTFVKVDSSGKFVSKYVAYSDPQFSTVVRDYINK